MNKEAREIIARLDDLYIKSNRMKDQLKASLDIQMLWPEAFKHGKCTSYLGGNLFKLNTMVFIVKDGQGNTKEFKLTDIPDHLFVRAIEFQKKPNGHNRHQCIQLDKLYTYVQFNKKKEQLK